MSMFGHPGELKIPPATKQDRSAQELLRVWSTGDHHEFSLKHDAWSDPAAWGLMLVDVARHVARHVARAFQERGHNYDEVYKRVLEGFRVEVDSPTDEPTGEIEK